MRYVYSGTDHYVFEQPPQNLKLWRYVSLAKFVSMLETESLHFARTDTLNDPFEGSLSKNEYPWIAVGADGKPFPIQPTQEEMRKGFERSLEERAALWRDQRESHAVNCWYISEHESAAMWLLYAKDGIAIETTVESLLASFPKGKGGDGCEELFAGLVQYIDYEKDCIPTTNSFWPFIYKRLSFAHEREYRAIISQWKYTGPHAVDPTKAGIPPEGILVPVDLKTLIQKVHVAPNSPAWFADTVRAVVNRFEHVFPVAQSQLDIAPYY